MKWNLASCLSALLLCSAAPARAATVLISQLDEHGDDVAVASFDFGSNQALARAWATLNVYRRDIFGLSDSVDEYTLVPTHVPGLSRIGDRIVYSRGARQTVCATVVHRRILFYRYDEVVKTGLCDVTSVRDVRRVDDSFDARMVPVLKVYFQVKE